VLDSRPLWMDKIAPEMAGFYGSAGSGDNRGNAQAALLKEVPKRWIKLGGGVSKRNRAAALESGAATINHRTH